MNDLQPELAAGVADIDTAAWDACACPETADGGPAADPFTTHRFLSLLERSGSVGQDTGWQPRPLLLRRAGEIVAAAPLYVKSHSQGEYIFDHGWADAYARAGGQYYPKLQVAVPFSPVSGRRLLARPGHAAAGRAALLHTLSGLAAQAGLSSAHLTFCTADEAAAAAGADYLHRVTLQYHWHNNGYAQYDDFLSELSSRKRKALRRERAQAQAFGGEIVVLQGDRITPEHWDTMWRFYQHTGARKWGRPYLTRAFFEGAMVLNDAVLMVLARRGGRWVAGALNLIGRDALFGRYWGAVEDHPGLHFELCYHQAVDWAIAHGLSCVEAGAQGEHKIARGYLPETVHSLHWFADPGFRQAVAQFLAAERAATAREMAELVAAGPFRRAETRG